MTKKTLICNLQNLLAESFFCKNHYIAVIKRYKKELLKVTDIVVADAFFSIRPFVDGIKECGFHLVSRFRDTASLYYVYTGPRSHTPGRVPRHLTEKSTTRNLTSLVWQSCILKDLRALPTHSLPIQRL